MTLRVGQGCDAHRFAGSDSGRDMWLAGLRWDDEHAGLEGDSDGDVAVHALIDALLAAAGLGDIGSLFGVGADAHGAGMHGADMLRETIDYLHAHGAVVQSASITIVGVRPKIGPRRAEAVAVLSRLVGCPVSLTATTTDRMGFTGRGEGLAALATALVNID